MYCKHCGKEIDADSSFCKHCGKSQDRSRIPVQIKTVWIVWVIFGFWTVLNLYFLLGSSAADPIETFFPYNIDLESERYRADYDISEFIVYVLIIPFLLYVIYRRIHKPIGKRTIVAISVFFIWIMANVILLMGWKYDNNIERFYPFNRGYTSERFADIHTYDYSEFIVYVFIIPTILFFVYRRFKKQIDKAITKLLQK